MRIGKGPGGVMSHGAPGRALAESSLTLARASSSEDLLSRPVVGAFLRASRYERYAASLKHVLPERRVRVPLREAFRELHVTELGDIDATALELLIGERLKVVLAGTGTEDTSSAFRRVAADYPEGFSLLGLAALPTHGALKRAYRSAAMAHHPDRGGTHQRMQEVNAAFAAMEAAISQGWGRVEEKGGGGVTASDTVAQEKLVPEEEPLYQEALLEIGIRSWAAYRLGVNRLLVSLSVSLCDLDGVRVHLSPLLGDPAWARLLVAWRSIEADSFNTITPDEKAFPRVARIPQTTPPLTGDLVDAYRMLILGKDRSTAGVIREWFYDSLPLHDVRDEYWASIREALEAPDPARFSNRAAKPCPDEAQYAFRSGLVGSSELDSILAQERERQRDRAERQTKCDEFVNSVGFIRLPDEELEEVDRDEECIAPEPGYFADRDVELSKEQWTEYLIAFQRAPISVDLVEKWQFSRLGRLRLWKRRKRPLRAAIEAEAHFFIGLFPDVASHWRRLGGEG